MKTAQRGFMCWTTTTPTTSQVGSLSYSLTVPADGRHLLRQSGNHGSLDGTKLSLMDYVAFLTSECQDAAGKAHYALSNGRLFQEFAVTTWATMEQDRIQYLMSDAGQKQLRAEKYQHVLDQFRAGDT
eukprot:135746-Chlamydomonas_euryale.AAC.1